MNITLARNLAMRSRRASGEYTPMKPGGRGPGSVSGTVVSAVPSLLLLVPLMRPFVVVYNKTRAKRV